MLFPRIVEDVVHNLLETNSNIFYSINISCIVILVKPEPYTQQQLYTTSLPYFQHRPGGVRRFSDARGE
jgi:hypothetical protein